MGRASVSRRTGSAALHLALIAVLGVLIYSSTFGVPFQWDDKDYIVGNPIVMDPGKPAEFRATSNVPQTIKTRSVAYLTFLVNYRAHGLMVAGYHAVNIAIHLINAVLVYWLVLLTFRAAPFTPTRPSPLKGEGAKREPSQGDGNAMCGEPPNKNIIPPLRGGDEGEGENSRKGDKKYIALFAALLFVSHPIQTQAVTYICQRFTSLVALFYLASVVLYAKWRLGMEQRHTTSSFPGLTGETGDVNPDPRLRGNDGKRKARLFAHPVLYLASLLSAVLAMKTKENAFTLPLAVALYEYIFFKASPKKRFLYLSPFILTMLVIPASLMDMDRPLGEAIGEATGRTQGLISRWDYLFTQFRVIVTYIRLLILPINQNLDYDYPLYPSFFNPDVLLSFFFLVLIIASGFYLLRKDQRVAAFGIFWFFLTLSVESSIIPLADVIFEHRVYLPSVGAFMSFAAAAYSFRERLNGRRAKAIAASAFTLTVIVLSVAAYERNRVWGTEITLWEDTVRKSPGKARGHTNLGRAYADGPEEPCETEKAMEHLLIAIRLDPDNVDAHFNLGLLYLERGSAEEARREFTETLRIDPAHRAKLFLDYLDHR